jgi:hypothetical protein
MEVWLMYDLRIAANLSRIDRAYKNQKLERDVRAVKEEETERIWGTKTFLRQDMNN